jgi:hypothetical protein
MRSDLKTYFQIFFQILALSVENCGFQGKNRGLVITKRTQG